MEEDILTETLTHNLALSRNQWSISNSENFIYKKKNPRLLLEILSQMKTKFVY
jgi:hypothetical protein